MILSYVLKNFRRRKVRTILMILSLMVSTGLIIAMSATVETIRRSNVDLISSSIGRYDITVSKTDISPDPFVDIDSVSQAILRSDSEIQQVYPRIVADVELAANGETATASLIARQPAEAELVGLVEVITGTLNLQDGSVALFEATAETFGVQVGDTVNLAYSFPRPREEGQPTVVGTSQRRVTGQYPVSAIVRQTGVVGAFVEDGIFMDFDVAQGWLGIPGRASTLISLVDPSLYESGNSEEAALTVRAVAVNVQAALGDQFSYTLDKAVILDASAQAFLILQALINTYGLMAFGVVGLLIHTLVMTNVQEQRREMAILRILGSQQNYLFAIVIVEVFVIGLIGVSLGVGFGQLLTQYAVLPFIENQMANEGLTVTIQPVVSWTTIVPSVLSAFAVLFISAFKPARDASKTKVMYAINPGVADNIQLEDLAELRESRPNLRLFFVGLVLLFTFIMVIGLDLVSTLGNPALEATFFLSTILLMVTGLGFVFLLLTRPLERVVLFIISFIAPRMTYFASRNVGRNNKRNTLISLLVLFSGVLPSFLATQNAIDFANIRTDVELDMGSPIELRVRSRFAEPGLEQLDWLQPSFITEDLAQFSEIENAVGLTNEYRAEITDAVGMRNTSLSLRGVTGDLNNVLFDQYVDFPTGDRAALTRLVDDHTGIVISEGLAEVLAVELGGIVKLRGAGLDHIEEFTVIGIARRVPGFDEIGRIRANAQGGSMGLISLRAHQRLSTDPNVALPDPDSKTITRILAHVDPSADLDKLDAELRQAFGFSNNLRMEISEVSLKQAQDEQQQAQVFLLVLTLISFTTAVFGVFAVIYVTIYARRKEIGMMKAVGSRKWELTGMLIIESIAMTLSAALAGIIAGASMGYIFAYIENVSSERPMIFAVDSTVMPFVIVMVVLASIIGAIFSARRIIKYKAIEILRMS